MSKRKIQEIIEAINNEMVNSPSYKNDHAVFSAINQLCDAVEELAAFVYAEPTEHDGEGKMI